MFSLIAFIAFAGAAQAGGLLKIITPETIINKEPGGGATDNRLTRNAFVTLIGGKKEGWYHVQMRNGEEGWVPDWTAEPAPADAQLSPAFPAGMLPTSSKPFYGVVVADNVSWRRTPYGGLNAKIDTTRGGFIPKGSILKLSDKVFHWFQAQISANEFVWVYDESVTPLTEDKIVSYYGVYQANLKGSNSEKTASGLFLSFELTAPVPYSVESNLSPEGAAFKLFGVKCGELPAGWDAACVKANSFCDCAPGTDVLEGRLPAPAGKMAGYFGRFEGNSFKLGARDASLSPIKRIAIDPGHGAAAPVPKGFADGTRNAKGVKEKDAVMEISRKLADALRNAGYEPFLTRDGVTSTMLDIYRRVEFANANGADLFISVHANGDTLPAMQGAEVYWNQRQSRPLAEYIAQELATATGRKPAGVFFASFGVIRQTETPAALVETGYMTNPEEGERYGDPAFLNQCAEGIARGVIRYVEYLNGAGK